ncbi:hypothetical protein ABBQ38_010636 [Trebouxia sp. C0009 RCD-2024]
MPRERIPRAARFVVKYLKTRAGGSEKKLAAKATAARKLHYTAGGGNQHRLPFHESTSARAHQLLLHTVLTAQSYPPFALLPLLQRGQKLSSAAIWPGANTIRRHHHIKSPCFAAKPLYAELQKPAPPVFPMRLQKLLPVKVHNIEAHKATPPSHPLYKYAALGRVQHIQSVPITADSRRTLTPLHTYARLAQPVSASTNAAVSAQQSRQALQHFAQLDKKLSRHTGAQVVSQDVPNNRNAFRSYARLGHKS